MGAGGLVRLGWGAAKGSRHWTMGARGKELDNKGLGRAVFQGVGNKSYTKGRGDI